MAPLDPSTLAYLWHLFSSYWSSSCPNRPTPRSGVSILPPYTRARCLEACPPLHCPAQALQPHCRRHLLLQGQQAGRPQVLSHESHIGWTASQLFGNPLGSLGTVCHREGRLRAACSTPGRRWRNLCRPGTQASGGGRTGPVGRATADSPLGPQSEGSSCSPRWGCWDGRSACSCWPADPSWCKNPSHEHSLFPVEEFQPLSESKLGLEIDIFVTFE